MADIGKDQKAKAKTNTCPKCERGSAIRRSTVMRGRDTEISCWCRYCDYRKVTVLVVPPGNA